MRQCPAGSSAARGHSARDNRGSRERTAALHGREKGLSSQEEQEKGAALRGRGTLHPRAEAVRDPAFVAGGFFDARDLVQVKYEMVRRVEQEGWGVGQAAAAFALSRQTFYQARAALARDGLPGLLPQPPGPRQGHKLTEAVLDFLEAVVTAEGDPSAAALAERVRERFGVLVHPRSIERGLARRRAGKGGGETG